MSEAREDVLASIRSALGVTGREAPRRAAVASRLDSAPSGPVPQRVRERDLSQLFIEGAERARASVAQVAELQDVPSAVASYLSTRSLVPSVRIGADASLSSLAWSAAGVEIARGPSAGGDACAVSHALAGVAETGTLVLISGRENPTTLNFLPDDHIVVIAKGDLAPSLESVWARLRVRFGARSMPRTVNLITGPSRSADIEQTMLIGVHGPRRVHVIIVGRS